MKPITALLVMSGERRGVVLEEAEACGVQVLMASGVNEARGILGTHAVDLVVTAATLPDGDWRDILTYCVEAGLDSQVILCARRLNRELCSEAFTRGAWDIVAESCSREELRKAIESAASRAYMHSLGSNVRVAGGGAA